MTIDYDWLKVRVENVSRAVSSTFPGYVSYDDIKGELWVWCLEHQDTVKGYNSDEDGEAKLHYVLKQKAVAFCQKEKAVKLGYSVDDLAFYKPKMLRELLNDVYQYEDWQPSGQNGDGQPGSKRIEPTSDRVEMMIDVKMGIEKLDPRNYSIIVGKFKYLYSDEEIADMLEVQVQSAPSSVSRALSALAKVLNNGKEVEPGDSYGRRTVRSNAAARADLSNHYDQ